MKTAEFLARIKENPDFVPAADEAKTLFARLPYFAGRKNLRAVTAIIDNGRNPDLNVKNADIIHAALTEAAKVSGGDVYRFILHHVVNKDGGASALLEAVFANSVEKRARGGYAEHQAVTDIGIEGLSFAAILAKKGIFTPYIGCLERKDAQAAWDVVMITLVDMQRFRKSTDSVLTEIAAQRAEIWKEMDIDTADELARLSIDNPALRSIMIHLIMNDVSFFKAEDILARPNLVRTFATSKATQNQNFLQVIILTACEEGVHSTEKGINNILDAAVTYHRETGNSSASLPDVVWSILMETQAKKNTYAMIHMLSWLSRQKPDKGTIGNMELALGALAAPSAGHPCVSTAYGFLGHAITIMKNLDSAGWFDHETGAKTANAFAAALLGQEDYKEVIDGLRNGKPGGKEDVSAFVAIVRRAAGDETIRRINAQIVRRGAAHASPELVIWLKHTWELGGCEVATPEKIVSWADGLTRHGYIKNMKEIAHAIAWMLRKFPAHDRTAFLQRMRENIAGKGNRNPAHDAFAVLLRAVNRDSDEDRVIYDAVLATAMEQVKSVIEEERDNQRVHGEFGLQRMLEATLPVYDHMTTEQKKNMLPLLRRALDNKSLTADMTAHDLWLHSVTPGRWNAILNMTPPEGLEKHSPYGFKPALYQKLLPLVRQMLKVEGKDADKTMAGADIEIVPHSAYKLSVLFNGEEEALRYVDLFTERQAKNSAHPFRDACDAINLPWLGKWNIAYWRDLAVKYGRPAGWHLWAASLIEKRCARLGIPLPQTPTEIEEQAAIVTYKKGELAPQFAKMAMRSNLDEKAFMRGIRVIEKGTKANDNIPAHRIDGKDVGEPGYYMERLPPGDPRGLMLGAEVNCCQHLGSNGQRCAIHGTTSPYGGFYVWKKKTDGKITPDDRIVAQSWVWLSRNNKVVFDSFERLSKDYDRLIVPFLKKFAGLAGGEVRLGTGGGIDYLKLPFTIAAKGEVPMDTKPYDAKKQYVIEGRAPGRKAAP